MSFQRKRIILVTVAFFGSAIFMAPFCGWMFACGCSWLWTTAGQLCNVHQAAPPHCPWCSHGTLGKIAPLAGLFAGAFVSGALALRLWQNLPLALGISLIAIFPVGVLMGLLTVLMASYPHFVLFR